MISGLIIAADGGDISHETKYDSRRKKLTVDPDANPAHFDVISLGGGTKWTISDSNRALFEEVIFKVKHNLPFKPQTSAYFYPTAIDSDLFVTSVQNQYSINTALMVFNASILGEEWLEAEADNQYFYIYHRAIRTDDAFGAGPWTTEGSNFTYRIRYFIFNQPGYMLTGGQTERAQ